MQQIGQLLLSRGLVTASALDNAVLRQQTTGDKLGEILVGLGAVRLIDLYQALAEQKKLPFVDLRREPIDTSVMSADERPQYVALQYLPFKKEGAVLSIAITNDDEKVKDNIRVYHPNTDIRWFLTSPLDISRAIQAQFEDANNEDATLSLWKEQPERSARFLWQGKGLLYGIIGLAILLGLSSLILAPSTMMFVIVSIFFACTVFFKCLIVTASYFKPENELPEIDFKDLEAKDLPTYTVLIPLFKEKMTTLTNVVNAMRRMNYPKSKLDVKLIVEADDLDTIENVKNLECEYFFEIIQVPFSKPQTKPKACNYALQYAKGEYITIYDAEDMPDPNQLLKAVAKFRSSDESVGCVQAKLNYYNHSENTLTKMFAIEYGVWFEFMLKGLEYLKLPIPLGGTSNHMPTKLLKEAYAWDPFNVTEDADLGIRLESMGYHVAVLDSTTEEEAPITVGTWIRQRSRWIKGYLQTFIVNMRSPLTLYRKLGMKRFLGFVFFVGAPGFIFLSLPFMLVGGIIYAVIGDALPAWFLPFAYVNLLFGIASHIIFAHLVIARKDWPHLLPFTYLFPLYWLLHCIASLKAVYQLAVKPHFWEKTEHGVSMVVNTLLFSGSSTLDKR